MTRRRLFCRGFAAWTDAQLREHFPWFCDVRPGVDRSEIEAWFDNMLDRIDYTGNTKGNIAAQWPELSHPMMQIWSAMYDVQDVAGRF